MYGNQAVDCNGAQIRAVCRQLATVVTVTGDIDESNLARVGACARRFVLTEKPFVLDLTGVNSFSPECISLLHDIDENCELVGVEWAVVASQPVIRTLRLFGEGETFPAVGSVAEALHEFAISMGERRRLLPLLTKTA
ncbi:STAS domain-containing protein [Mycolicibacterium sp. 120270]|uniref:STAS domain-containing protein n=1 Tax=Mycolicibacterium sp. 120270 TaxID=3090600 RepID=UPI00299E2FDC|nr:STAS domain-containing protein [Mycolicibacterium sp. 120270]MDX1885715.1 STAS domain-containing protein [Mycolicibacterium sp. 120270]